MFLKLYFKNAMTASPLRINKIGKRICCPNMIKDSLLSAIIIGCISYYHEFTKRFEFNIECTYRKKVITTHSRTLRFFVTAPMLRSVRVMHSNALYDRHSRQMPIQVSEGVKRGYHCSYCATCNYSDYWVNNSG